MILCIYWHLWRKYYPCKDTFRLKSWDKISNLTQIFVTAPPHFVLVRSEDKSEMMQILKKCLKIFWLNQWSFDILTLLYQYLFHLYSRLHLWQKPFRSDRSFWIQDSVWLHRAGQRNFLIIELEIYVQFADKILGRLWKSILCWKLLVDLRSSDWVTDVLDFQQWKRNNRIYFNYCVIWNLHFNLLKLLISWLDWFHPLWLLYHLLPTPPFPSPERTPSWI